MEATAVVLIAVLLSACATGTHSGWGGYAPLMDNTAVVESGAIQAEGALDMPDSEPVAAGVIVRRGLGRGTELTGAISDCVDPGCRSLALGARWTMSEGRAYLPALRLGGVVIGAERGVVAVASEVVAGWDLGAGFGLEGIGAIERQRDDLDGSVGLELARSFGGRLDVYVGGARGWSGAMDAGVGVVGRPFARVELDFGVWSDVNGSGARGMSLVVARRW